MGEGAAQRVGGKADDTGRDGGRARAAAADTATPVAPRARDVLRLQSAAGNAAVARAIKHRAAPALRPPDGGGGGGSGAAPGGPTAAPPAGAAETAIVASTTDTVKLRASGSDHAKIVAELGLNQRLFLGERTGNWRFASTASGAYGYLAEWLIDRGLVKTNLPDPLSRLHEIASGETALGIAEHFYGGLVKPGQDLRFYVNVLEYVNRGPGPRGIYQPDPSDTSTGAWKNVKARAGYLVWIPSSDFAQSLKGVVKSGSITGGLWSKARGALEAIEDFAIGGAAFVAGLVKGALSSVRDLLVGLKDLAVSAWKLLETVFQGKILSEAKGLWEAVRHLKPRDIAESWIANFVKRWGAKSLWSRWQFRGWVIGYAIAEIGLLLISGGGTAAAKLATKMGRAASWVLRHIGDFAKRAGALAKRVPRKLVEALRVRSMKLPFPKAWSEMSKAERGAFQHSYSNHGHELGLPKWSQKNADALRDQFNRRVAEIRTQAQHVRKGQKPVGLKGSGQGGKMETVRIFEYTDAAGVKWYYYETLSGRFVSAGLDTK